MENVKCWWCQQEHPPQCRALLEAHAQLRSDYAQEHGQLTFLENELVKLRRIVDDTLKMVINAKS